MNGSEAKKSKSRRNYPAIILYLIIGAVIGFYAGKLIGMGINEGYDSGLKLLAYIFFSVVILIFMVYFHLIAHEAGHLLFGILTGYGFVSFRIMKLMLMKEHGHIKRKKYTVVGTGGQCLMSPPNRISGSYPYILYNLGGVILNLICGFIFLLLYLATPSNSPLLLFFLLNLLLSVSLAVMNGLPMKINGLPNDGCNVLLLKRDIESKNAFWMQLKINSLLSSGTRLRDMPSEWFEYEKNINPNNPLTCAMDVYRCAYYHDRQDFSRAKEESLFLLENAPGLVEVHRNELLCELLFYEVIGDCRLEEVERLYTDKLKSYIKATASYISRKRLQYVIERFVYKNEAEAKKQLDAFEALSKTYPYASEVRAEREIFNLLY